VLVGGAGATNGRGFMATAQSPGFSARSKTSSSFFVTSAVVFRLLKLVLLELGHF
jgi:hypothetical protein